MCRHPRVGSPPLVPTERTPRSPTTSPAAGVKREFGGGEEPEQEQQVIDETTTPAYLTTIGAFLDWMNMCIAYPVLFFAPLGLFYQWKTGDWCSWSETAWGLFEGTVRGTSYWGVLHRFFCHQSWSASRPVAFVLGLYGCTAAQRGPLWWASKHLRHHKYCDNSGPYPHHDPHSLLRIKHFIYCYAGWVFHPYERRVDWDFLPQEFKVWEMLLVEACTWVVPFGELYLRYRFISPHNALWYMYYTTFWFYMTLALNTFAHGDEGDHQTTPTKEGRYKCGAIDMKQWYLVFHVHLLGERNHKLHHQYPRMAYRDALFGFDIFYWCVIWPCEKLGLFYDVRSDPKGRVPVTMLKEVPAAKPSKPTPVQNSNNTSGNGNSDSNKSTPTTSPRRSNHITRSSNNNTPTAGSTTTTITAAASKVDMVAHTGLRALAACWIAVFHVCIFTPERLNIQGSSWMPLFFLLSGFSLTIMYSKEMPKQGNGSATANPQLDDNNEEEEDTLDTTTTTTEQPRAPFDVHAFWQNRAARVLPVLYVTSLPCLALLLLGYAGGVPHPLGAVVSVLMTLVPCATLFTFIPGFLFFFQPLNGISWTVATLAVFWYMFPNMVARAKRLSDGELVRGLVWCYWGQFALIVGLFYGLFPLYAKYSTPDLYLNWNAFGTASMHPFSRLPVFVMGMLAALLVQRHPAAAAASTSTTSVLPWPTVCLGLPVTTKANATTSQDEKSWARVATTHLFTLISLHLLLGAADIVAMNVHGLKTGLRAEVWLQGFVPFLQLTLLVAVTRDGGRSIAAKLLRSRLAQWLGGMSMCIYLVHYPLHHVAGWATHGFKPNAASQQLLACALKHWSDPTPCADSVNAFIDGMLPPLWAGPYTLVASLVTATLLSKYVEGPARKAFRARVKAE